MRCRGPIIRQHDGYSFGSHRSLTPKVNILQSVRDVVSHKTFGYRPELKNIVVNVDKDSNVTDKDKDNDLTFKDKGSL